MLAQLLQGCVCDTEALKQNCATSPSKCIFVVTSVDMLNLAVIHLYVMHLNFSWLSPCATAALSWKAWSHLSRTGLRNGRRRLINWTKTMPKVTKAQSLAINICCQHWTTEINWCICCFFWVFFAFFWTEYKRSRQEIKRKSLDTMKLQKKARKGEKLICTTQSFGEFGGDSWLTGWWFGLDWRPLEDCIRNHSPVKSKWLL